MSWWFWGGSDKGGKADNPYKNLDPSLRDYLKKESPSQTTDQQDNVSRPAVPQRDHSSASSTNTPHVPSTNYRALLGLDRPGITPEEPNAEQQAPSSSSSVPTESLYQDGRYAHLWKNYRPQAEIDAASRSDQDKLADIAEALRNRKAMIARAALENCVVEQMEERNCYAHGGFMQTMTMCRTEARAFFRCYEMQARFLKALGYLSHAQATEEEGERIQMHADKLFHEMLDRERVKAEAKEKGEEIPVFQPLIQHEKVEQALGTDSAWSKLRRMAAEKNVPVQFSQFTPQKQQEIRERIKHLSDEQKELELQLIAAEQRASLSYAEQVQEHVDDEILQRRERRESGKETFGDRLKRLGNWTQ